ncbi:MAG: hypothetical protein ABEJ62_01905 [Candidatus Nanohaloarchaea archaeon]
MRRKGQSFVIGAIIFSLLVVLVYLNTGPELINPGASTQGFFSQSLEESSSAFNDALEDNRSAKYTARRMQSYDRFIERTAKEKGITYSSYTLVLLPGEGEAGFINHYPGSLEARLKTGGGWKNETVAPGQSFYTSFSPGLQHFHLEIAGRNETYSLDAATPRIVKHSMMESSGETWENTLVG